MSAASEISTGLAGGAVITYAVDQAGMPPSSTMFIGGGAGLVLALMPTSRRTGLALLLASVVGASLIARPRRRLRRTGY